MAYTGPGDIVSGALGWWGLRAYSAAKAATAPYTGIIISDSGGSNTQAINILTTGDLDVAAIQTYITTFGSAVLFQINDQIGTRHLSGPTVHAVVISPSGLATGRAAVHLAENGQFGTPASDVTTVQPFTVSTFANSIKTSSEGWLFAGPTTVILSYDRGGAANLVTVNSGADASATAAEGVWHAVQGVYNGASSGVNVDGVANNGLNAGTNVLSADSVQIFSPFSVAWRGDFVEFGLWSNKGFSDTESGNMSNNQTNYWIVGPGATILMGQAML